MISEETRQIKEEAKARGETVRVYPLSNDSKLYIFFKDGKPIRSAWKSLAWDTLEYYDYETTLRTIAFWQEIGKVPVFPNTSESNPLETKNEHRIGNKMNGTGKEEKPGYLIIFICIFAFAFNWIITGSFFAAIFLLPTTSLIFYLPFWIWQKRKEKKRKEIEALHQRMKSKFEAEQREKGLEKFIDEITGEERWGTPEQVGEWQKISRYLKNNFSNLSPSEFEEFIAELFRKIGYDVELTPGGGDYGFDVIAKDKDDTVGIQCKLFRMGNNVGARDVQRALGSMWYFKANKAIIVTTSDFTIQAKIQAKESPIELWNRKILHQMVRKYFLGEVTWETIEDSKYIKSLTCSKNEIIKKCSIFCPKCGEFIKTVDIPAREDVELTLPIECKKCGLIGKTKITTEKIKTKNKTSAI